MNEVKLYTTSYCSYCNSAKQLLSRINIPFNEVNLDGQDELRAKLSAENGGYRTVPMIFIGEEFIGGYTELAALHQKGLLLTKIGNS